MDSQLQLLSVSFSSKMRIGDHLIPPRDQATPQSSDKSTIDASGGGVERAEVASNSITNNAATTT